MVGCTTLRVARHTCPCVHTLPSFPSSLTGRLESCRNHLSPKATLQADRDLNLAEAVAWSVTPSPLLLGDHFDQVPTMMLAASALISKRRSVVWVEKWPVIIGRPVAVRVRNSLMVHRQLRGDDRGHDLRPSRFPKGSRAIRGPHHFVNARTC